MGGASVLYILSPSLTSPDYLSPRTRNMAMFRYLKRERPACPAKVPSLSEEEVHRVNEDVKRTMEQDETSKKGRGKYNDYTAKERAQIGKYAAENGPARAVRHFSSILDRKLPETTARRLKSEYLLAITAKLIFANFDFPTFLSNPPNLISGNISGYTV